MALSRLLLIFFILPAFILCGQGDTLGRYSPGFKFKDGLYLSFEDFKANCPAIPISELRDAKGDAISDIEEADHVFRLVNDTLRKIAGEDIYGYSNKGQVSIASNSSFDRLVVVGTLCHIVHREVVVDYGRGGLYDYNSIPVRREVQTEYVIDMRTGEKSLFTAENLAFHIEDDRALASTYAAKNRKQRKMTRYATLHSYNRTHPVYFSLSMCR